MDNKVVQWVTRSTPLESRGAWKRFVQERKEFDKGGQVIGKPGGLVEPGVMYYGTSKVKTKKFKYKVSNQHGTYYTDKPGLRIDEKPLTPAERTARYREKNPYKLKTTDIVADGVKYTIPHNAMKPESAKGFIKFLNKLEKDPTIENYRRLVKGLPDDVANQARNYRYYLQGKKSGSFTEGKSGDNLKKLYKELNLPKKSTNFLKNVTTADIKAEIVKTSATPQRAANQRWKSAEKVIDINNQFKQNPKITLEQLTKNLYKTEFTKADKVGKLRLMTTVSDDVAKYLQALKNARAIPRGLKSEFIAPTGKNLDNIKKYITSQSEGFRFREGTLRNYKYSIRDSLLEYPENYTRNLENKLKIKGVLDHAVGLSATHEVAPGYTGLYQDLEKKLNDVKGTDIDRDFTRVLREVIKDKNFKNVDAYNKQASKFHKTHKGKIDVPFIRQGGDPTKLVKSFYDLDEPSQKNILKLAEGPQGIAIETKGKTIKTLELDVAKEMKAQGFKCKVTRANGGVASCNNPRAYLDDIAKQREIARAGSGKQAVNAARKLRGLKTFMTANLGPAAILGEIAFAVPFALADYASGESTSRIINFATFGALGESERDEIVKYGGEQAGLAFDAMKRGQQLQKVESQADLFMGPDDSMMYPDILKGAQKRFDKSIEPFMQTDPSLPPGIGLRYFDEEMGNQYFNKLYKAQDDITRDKGVRSKERTANPYEEAWAAAGGGIAGVRRPHAIPPKSGPMPQGGGLSSMFNRVRKW